LTKLSFTSVPIQAFTNHWSEIHRRCFTLLNAA
jgi:hypothetical protein